MKTDHPDFKDWDFSKWLYCVCDSNAKFLDARSILIDEFGYDPSVIEEGASDQALVMPMPGVDLDHILNHEDYNVRGWSWGVGRTRLSENSLGHYFDFKYFYNCPWEIVRENPARDAMVRLYDFLKPTCVYDAGSGVAREIDFPYLG